MLFNYRVGALFGILAALTVVSTQDVCPGAPTWPNEIENCNAWHTIVDGDNCDTVPAKYGKTREQFLLWNPDVSSDCRTNFWSGYAYCVGTGSSKCTTTSTSTSTAGSSSTRTTITSSGSATYSSNWPITPTNGTTIPVETAWPPQRTQAGQPASCRWWHNVGIADTCESIATGLNPGGLHLSMSRLLEWNPSLGEDCSGLFVGWWVCVGLAPTGKPNLGWSRPVGNGTAEPPTPTEHTSRTTTTVPAFTPSPVQAGIPSSCQAYRQTKADENCDAVLREITYITREQFYEWNPALDGNCEGMWLNYYYCVANFNEDTPAPMPTTTTKPKADVAEGIVADCKAWYRVPTEDTCDDVVELFGTAFTREGFIRWNPTVMNDCSRITGGIFYCVAVPGTPTTKPPPPTTTTPPPVSTPSNCADVWIVVDGDSCAAIAAWHGISVPILMEWNRDLLGEGSSSSACTSRLVVDARLCIRLKATGTGPVFEDDPTDGTEPSSTSTSGGGSATSMTTTRATATTDGGGGVSTPTPTQPGMVEGCIRFYWHGTARDGCWAIADANGISLDDFYKWNTGVGTDCSALWLDTYHCVGVSGSPTTIGGPQPT